MMTFRALEDVDQRVLGALRFVSDIDGALITAPLRIGQTPLTEGQNPAADEAGPLRVARNRQGLYVILGARDRPLEHDFAKYISSFDPPTAPPTGARVARLRVEDPSSSYFPLDFELALPRSLTPQDPKNPAVSAPQLVRLLPSPVTAASAGWSVCQLVVWRDVAGTDPVRQTMVPVALVLCFSKTETDPNGHPILMGRALTEWRTGFAGARPTLAQAQVCVPGVPITDWNRDPNGNVITTGRDVTLEIRVDTKFNPAGPGAIPSLARLDPGAEKPLPDGVLSGKLDQHLEARERRSLHVAFNADGTALRVIPRPNLN